MKAARGATAPLDLFTDEQRERYSLPPLLDALEHLHRPPDELTWHRARRTLAFHVRLGCCWAASPSPAQLANPLPAASAAAVTAVAATAVAVAMHA